MRARNLCEMVLCATVYGTATMLEPVRVRASTFVGAPFKPAVEQRVRLVNRTYSGGGARRHGQALLCEHKLANGLVEREGGRRAAGHGHHEGRRAAVQAVATDEEAARRLQDVFLTGVALESAVHAENGGHRCFDICKSVERVEDHGKLTTSITLWKYQLVWIDFRGC
jgi:hypothetical protein